MQHGLEREEVEEAALDMLLGAIANGHGFVVVEIKVKDGRVISGGGAVMSIGQNAEQKRVTATALLQLSRALAREL